MPASRPFPPLSSGLEEHHVGTSDLELEQTRSPALRLHVVDHGARHLPLYRESHSKKLAQHQCRPRSPEKYRAEDGSSSVNLDFDWDGDMFAARRKQPVDLTLKEGTRTCCPFRSK